MADSIEKLLNAQEQAYIEAFKAGTRALQKKARPLSRFRAFAEIAAWHHERWDGGGYPDGLTRDEIPLLARIVAVADAWDAMTGDRIYRKGMSVEKALGILEAEADDGQFDPDLIRLFVVMIKQEMATGGTEKVARGARSDTPD